MHGVFDVDTRVVDHLVGAEGPYKFDVGGRHGSDHVRTFPMAELDAEGADTTRSALAQQALTGLEMSGGEQPVPCGLAADVQGCCLLEGDAFGDAGYGGRGRDGELRIGAGAATEDAVSDGEPSDAVAEDLDRACNVETGCV